MLSNNVIVEEKVDGANMGLSLGENGMIRAQNRSHFVDSTYHEQFKLLGKWINKHSEELTNIFSLGDYIIYGEWLYMQHSINYIKLPDYFLIYDIYDKTTNSFLARHIVTEMLKDTTLKQVPIIFEGEITIDKLKTMVQSQSKFYDGPVEGIYVRAICDDFVKYRGKIVRHNFISGNDHWTKGKYVINTIIDQY